MKDAKLSPHFSLREFRCHDGTPPPADFPETIRDTIEFLERLRFLVNMHIMQREDVKTCPDVGIEVVSGYRTAGYNRKVGGAAMSRHVTGQAADVKPARPYDGVLPYDDFRKLAELVDASFPSRPYRMGFYPRKGAAAWIHVDCAYGFGAPRW